MRNPIGIFPLVAVVAMAFTAAEHTLKPPKQPPTELVSGYTLNGKIKMESFFVDDTNDGKGTHYKFPTPMIENYIKGARQMIDKLNHTLVRYQELGLPENAMIQRTPKEQWLYFAVLSNFILEAKLPMEGGTVAVIGSTEPWVEAISLSMGAAHVTTIEYNELTYSHEKISTISGKKFTELYACNGSAVNTFDFVITMSSLDHDGLGRYGDPLNPQGDLEAMQRIADLLKPDGLLILTVPVGPDVVVFNLHRRYGNIRLPKLLKGFEIIGRIGWDEERLTKPAHWRQTYEPVFILKKKKGKTGRYVSKRCPNLTEGGKAEFPAAAAAAAESGETGANQSPHEVTLGGLVGDNSTETASMLDVGQYVLQDVPQDVAQDVPQNIHASSSVQREDLTLPDPEADYAIAGAAAADEL